MKQSFEQSDGLLSDLHIDEGYSPRMPDEREVLLGRIAAGRPYRDAFHAARALGSDRSPDVLEALLEGLENGAVPSRHLLPYLDDPRVRPAILSAAARTRLVQEHESNVLRLLGLLGGEAAAAMLRSAIEGFLEHPSLWEPHDFVNWYAYAFLVACEGLLALDAEATFAADAMIRMFEHPCANIRSKAVRQSAELLRMPRALGSEAALRLRAALRPMLDAEARLFVRAAPVLVWTDRDAVVERCKDILRNRGDSLVHGLAVDVLAEDPRFPDPEDTLTTIIDAIRNEPSLFQAYRTSARVVRLLPPELVASLVRRGLAHESPWMRYQAAGWLRMLPSDVAEMLAEQARIDEPDAVIRWSLDHPPQPPD